MFKVNNRNTRTGCEICSKLTIKTPEQRQGVVLVSVLLFLTYFTPCSSVYIVNFELVNADEGKAFRRNCKVKFVPCLFLGKVYSEMIYQFPGS